MFTVALFTIAKTWKQPKCPKTEEWIKKKVVVCIFSGILVIKNNEIMSFAATWIVLEILILRELSEKEIYDMTSLIFEI